VTSSIRTFFSDQKSRGIYREAENMASIRKLCLRLVSYKTQEVGVMEVPEVKLQKWSEQESDRLEKVLAEAMLDNELLQAVQVRKY